MGNNDNKDDCCSDEDMMMRKWRRTRITVGTDEDEDKDDYCFHEVMMMRRWRRRTTTRTDYNIEYCCEEEKEDNEEKDMDVCMVPIGQYINHCTRPDTV